MMFLPTKLYCSTCQKTWS